MTCKCGSNRIADVFGKCSDMSVVRLNNNRHEGYVPRDLGIGGGDNIEFDYCLDCGQIQGQFPLPQTELELEMTEMAERFSHVTGETPAQREFRLDMEMAGLSVVRYSGRGMFGRETYGVYCHPTKITEQMVRQATDARLTADTMGKGTILYLK